MYNLNLGLGLDGKLSYCDDDTNTYQRVLDELRGNICDFLSLLLPFFTIISPGGSLSNIQFNKLKKLILKKITKHEAKKLRQVEKELMYWRTSDTFNSEAVIRNIFRILNPNNLTWIDYGQPEDFPNNGFFTTKKFKVQA